MSRLVYDSERDDMAAVDCSVHLLDQTNNCLKMKKTDLVSAARNDSATALLASTDAFSSTPKSHH